MIFLRNLRFKEYNLKNEILSGLTVALALVPEAVAFSIIAGVSPLIGLYSAFIIGLIAAAFGGRPGMISGATGAIAVVVVALVARHGVEYLFAAVVLMGLIQILIGLLKLGKFIRLVPHAVMFGFVNGLAIVIFMSQFEQFKTTDASGVTGWMSGQCIVDNARFCRADDGDYLSFAETHKSRSVVARRHSRRIFDHYRLWHKHQNSRRHRFNRRRISRISFAASSAQF